MGLIGRDLRSSTTPVQKIVTSAKGVALDFDAVSRDLQAHSKEVYLWGQTESSDIKDGASFELIVTRVMYLLRPHQSPIVLDGSVTYTARFPLI